ncbi:MAG TPA: 4Fe-4S dicluster domain-containing protein [Phycisphaerae bacterium]|nr:4Fe-4S dicluster domain-containing protein [Phycisphaerae bacterium]
MRLKRKGGYNVPLAGRPAGQIDAPAEADTLWLPLGSRRFAFTQLAVGNGEMVKTGQVLATDPANFDVPLLAPRDGTVRLGAVKGHLVLENARRGPARIDARRAETHPAHGDGEAKRRALVRLGAWQFFEDAHTGRLPDPFTVPRAVIVSTVRLEPFLARGDAQLADRLDAFARGLECLQSLLEYQRIYLLVPDVQSELAETLHENLRGLAWLQIVTIPRRYPMDHFALVARGLGLKAGGDGPVWAVRTEGVLAVDRALSESRPVTERVISLGGPAVGEPVHLALPVGYPLEKILLGAIVEGLPRVLTGGALTGEALDHAQKGLDAECAGLTVLAEPKRRELFGWLRPGWGRASYGRCYLSALHRPRPERLTTAMRGEKRACIACGQCETVCPARILPHVIHKALYTDAIDDAEHLGVDLCVGCGLCAFVCPSKIELRQEFLDAQQKIREERAHAEAAKAEEVKG